MADIEKTRTDETEAAAEEGDPIAKDVMQHRENAPTKEEKSSLRRVPGSIPVVAYLICAVEFAERASYYGVVSLITNFVTQPLPAGGNGAGAPPVGTQQIAGALGLGLSKANAIQQSYSLLAFCLPVVFGWLSDKFTGRFKMVCYGVVVVGIAHIIMLGSGAPSLLQAGNATGPYMLSLYLLSIGAAMFKPNISPLLLDQVRDRDPEVKELPSGERVIVDPEATVERVILWFYLLINVGAFAQLATVYSEKYVGYWLSFLIPLILYLPLPALLWYLHKRLILYPPGGNDLGNVFRILGLCLRSAGITGIGRAGFWEHAKPSVIAQSGWPIDVPWTDHFVNDVRRTFQAAGIFCFVPIQFINDVGLGISSGGLSLMLTTNGVPNDVIGNFSTIMIIVMAPSVNYGLYPLLRKWRINFGPVRRITFGLFVSGCGGVAYTVLTYYAYQQSPCGDYGSSDCMVGTGVAPISIWWMTLPVGLGAISEIFVDVPMYGIAYSRAPKNMRGLVASLNLFLAGFSSIIGLACTSVVQDPYLVWDFGAPAIIGFVASASFFIIFRHLDKEDCVLSRDDEYETALQQRAADEHLPAAEREPSIVAAVEASKVAKAEE